MASTGGTTATSPATKASSGGCSCRIGSAPSGSALLVLAFLLLVRHRGRR
jgi:MYXO-CTERM domain-containing protein